MFHILKDNEPFPPAQQATEEGIVAIGGDLSPARLLSAYRQGIFPWFNDDEPVIWWSPDPRMVLFPDELKVSKSMAKLIKKQAFSVSYNQNFREVITQCSQVPRAEQDGTWITQDMIEAYCQLHQLGHALSVEVWQHKQLVGGLYGIDLGNQNNDSSVNSNHSNFQNGLKLESQAVLDTDCESMKHRGAQCINNTRAPRQAEKSASSAKSKLFCGESMFSKVSNASKFAFISLVQKLQVQGYDLIDCQLHTDHLASLGAREVSREAFLSYL